MILSEKIVDFAPDAIIVTDSLGRIVRVNSQAESLFGYTAGELLGQAVEILVPERFRSTHSAKRESEPARHRVRPFGSGIELSARRKDGREFPVDIMLNSVGTGNDWFAVAIIRDVTERKQAEEKLRESEESLRLLIEGVKDYAIFRLDPEGKIASWNSAAEHIYGYKGAEIVGQHFSRFYVPADTINGTHTGRIEIAFQQGRLEEEGWRVRKDGSRFWANVTTTALTDDHENLHGYARITRDVTAQKRADEALVLEITDVLVAKRDIRGLLSAICASLTRVKPHDRVSLALRDPNTNYLRPMPLNPSEGADPVYHGGLLPIDGTPPGLAFRSGKAVVLNRIEPRHFPSGVYQRLRNEGLTSACFLPLVKADDCCLGILSLYSRREAAFADEEVDLLGRVTQQVALAMDNALAFRRITQSKEKLVVQNRYLKKELRTHTTFDEIIGESTTLKRVLKQVENVAGTETTVLILGETGTGKELLARAIHKLSLRRDNSFIKFNCAAIPIGLLESELFGHERGAFTGAVSRKMGRLDLADGGTLFLDEVGDIPLELQPKLLRVLQEQEFERLGSSRTIPVDIRLVAATNRKLTQMVAEERFRDDLYYRLNVFPITVPALRDRRDDIPALVHHFTTKCAARMNKRVETIPPEAMQALTEWHWPGNVRELANFIERAVILTRGPVLQIPLAELQRVPETTDLISGTLEAAEREAILRVLRETGGRIGGPRGAALRLGVKRTTLVAKMRRLHIARPGYGVLSSNDHILA